MSTGLPLSTACASRGGQQLDSRIVRLRPGAFHFMAAFFRDMPERGPALRAPWVGRSVSFAHAFSPRKWTAPDAKGAGPYFHQPGRNAAAQLVAAKGRLFQVRGSIPAFPLPSGTFSPESSK